LNGPWSPLGSALAAFHDLGEDVAVTIRNDFGPTEEIHPSFFFRKEDSFEEWESIALRQCGQRVLDIGAGVGAHALVLQARGHEVTALDLIPEAVRIMQERGVEDARKGTVFELPPAQLYDTVILLTNGSMIAETLSGLDRLLAAAATVLDPRGALILDSTDLRDVRLAEGDGAPENRSENSPENESTHEPDNDPEDGHEDDERYVGELHYQLSVGEHVGEVFPQLFVDPNTLDERARSAGWNMEVLWSGPDGRYLARLQRDFRSVPNDAAGQDHAVSEALA
jgi:SAM-dependent methyltransferase